MTPLSRVRRSRTPPSPQPRPSPWVDESPARLRRPVHDGRAEAGRGDHDIDGDVRHRGRVFAQFVSASWMTRYGPVETAAGRASTSPRVCATSRIPRLVQNDSNFRQRPDVGGAFHGAVVDRVEVPERGIEARGREPPLAAHVFDELDCLPDVTDVDLHSSGRRGRACLPGAVRQRRGVRVRCVRAREPRLLASVAHFARGSLGLGLDGEDARRPSLPPDAQGRCAGDGGGEG